MILRQKSALSKAGAALLLASLAAACELVSVGLKSPRGPLPDAGSSADGSSAMDGGGVADGGTSMDAGQPATPTILSNMPVDGARDVALDSNITATFSEPMAAASLTATTFSLLSAADSVPVAGTVVYAGSTAVFRPSGPLAANHSFTATITTGVESAAGVALAAERAWTFTTGNPVALPVNLRTAGNYVILAKGGISGTTATITGDLGVSPAAATYITGFSLIADATNVFSTSAQITGRVYAADYVSPTPAALTAAVIDLDLALTDAAGRAPAVIELGAGNIGGMTLAPGVYRWASGLTIATNVTLSGSATAVWIFQIAQDLSMSAGTHIVLTGGALAKNVFWQVSGGPVTLGATAHLEGIVLTRTSVTLGAGASIEGRLLAQTAVIVDGSTIVESAP